MSIPIDVQRTRLVGIDIPTGVSNPVRAGLERAIAASFVTSFRVFMLISAALAAASAFSASFLIEGKQKAVTQPATTAETLTFPLDKRSPT